MKSAKNTEHIASLFRELILAIGENVDREGLKDTPQRAARAFEFITQGYRTEEEGLINNAFFTTECEDMVVVKNIEFFSLCEHHLMPFIGKCHVGYLPKGKVIGLSKIARIVDMFAYRLQIQENMTRQIAESILQCTNTRGVAVVIEAQHLCMMMRGVEKQHASMKTSCMLGLFQTETSLHTEFMRNIT